MLHRQIILTVVGSAFLVLTGLSLPHPTSAQETPAKRAVMWQRACQIAPGKGQEAVKWAKDMNEYVASLSSEVSWHVYAETFKAVGRIHWVANHKDLTSVESLSDRVASDSGAQERLSQASEAGLFAGCEDTLFRELP